MRVKGLITKYLLLEMVPPFIVNLAIFSFIFLMAKILDIADWVVNYGIGLAFVFLLVLQTIPTFLVFVVPMSTMLGVLLGLLRLSSDNEVVGLKAGGVSIYSLVPAVLIFCLVGCVITGFMCVYGSPWGRQALRATLFKAAKSSIDMGLKAGQFNETFKGVMLYAGDVDHKEKALRDLFVEDRQSPGLVSTIISPMGKFSYDQKNTTFRLTFFNGVVNKVEQASKTVHSVTFDTYEINLELAKMLALESSRQKSPKEMNLLELWLALKRMNKNDPEYLLLKMEFHKRLALPFSCLTLGIVAIPLGVQSQRLKRSFGMVLGLFFFLFYYVLMSAGWVLGEAGLLGPAISVWGPNLIIGAIGTYLLVRSAAERPANMINWLEKMFRGPKSTAAT